MRFYIFDGWTKEELDICCVRGEVTNFHPEDTDPYFMLDHRRSSAFDAVKLVELVSEIHPPGFWTKHECAEFSKLSMEQVIEHYNW